MQLDTSSLSKFETFRDIYSISRVKLRSNFVIHKQTDSQIFDKVCRPMDVFYSNYLHPYLLCSQENNIKLAYGYI